MVKRFTRERPKNTTMPATKSVPVSFRVTTEFKSLLELAAQREQRSQTNLLEKLLLDHCRKRGITAASVKPHVISVAAKDGAR